MTKIVPLIRRMTFEESQLRGLHSRGLILEHQSQSYFLNAGTRDTIHVFTRSIGLYVLTINIQLGYMGLDAYMPQEPDPINTIFFHSEQDIAEVLGSKWKYMSLRTITTRLMDYLF